jgi:hypothetical protein
MIKQTPAECSIAKREPLKIVQHPEYGTVEIEGEEYSYEFLTKCLPHLVRLQKELR